MRLTAGFSVINVSGLLSVLGGNCKGIGFNMAVRPGNGYYFPPEFLDAINDDLKAKGLQPIDAQRGAISDLIPLWDRRESIPAGMPRCVQTN
jgi:hypothetical protein